MAQVFDEKLIFSKDQALTETAPSTDVLDMEHMEEIGVGKPLTVVVRVTEDFATATSFNIQVQDSADDSTFANIGVGTGVVVIANLKAGDEFRLPLPDQTRRYVRLNYTKDGSNATAGKVYAGLVQG